MTGEGKHVESCRGVVKFFDNTVRNVALYPPEHPSVRAPVKRMHDCLSDLFRDREEVLLGVINGVLYVDNYLFYEATPYSDHVLKTLTKFGVDDLVFSRGLEEKDLLCLAAVSKSKDGGRDVFIRLLGQTDARHIALKSFVMGKSEEGDVPARSLEAYRDAVSSMEGIYGEVSSGRLPPLREAERLVETFATRLSENRALLMLLSTIKAYDAYTYQHSVNVGILAMLLAEFEGMGDRALRLAALAGMMHDLGKARVDESVLNKPGGLTLREWELVKAHPVHSAQIVRGMGGAEDVAKAVEGHHLHFGGGGYPVLAGNLRPTELAGLVAVADSYDAITTVRSYKRPMNPIEAIAYLESGRGTKFDPRHVDALVSMVGAFPPGVMVRLSTREIGLVMRPGKKPGRPVLRMIVDPKGVGYPEPWELDLSSDHEGGRLLASTVDPVIHGLDPNAHLS